MNAMLFLAAYILSAAVLPRRRGRADAALEVFTISAAIIVIVETVLGAANSLSLQNVLIVTTIITIVVCLLYSKKVFANARLDEPQISAEGRGDRPGVAALLFLAAAAVVLFFYFIEAAATPPPPTDAFTDHLYFPAVWLQRGNLTLIARAAGDQAVFYYPLNGSLLFLWLMLPFREDTICNLVQLFSLIACCAAIYSLSRKMGAGKSFASIAAALPVFTPLFILRSTNSDVDILFCAFFLAGLNFAFMYAETAAPATLALCAVAFGLFAGTKPIAALYLAPALPVLLWIIIKRAGRGGIRKIASHAAIFIFGMAALCAYWYGRNIALTGNPLYPLEIKLSGAAIFPGAFGQEAMLGSVFHSSSADELRAVLAGWTFGAGLSVFAVLTAAAGVPLLLYGITKKRVSALGALALAMPFYLLYIYWFVNPHNTVTNCRFLMPAVCLLYVLFAYAAGKAPGGNISRAAFIAAAAACSAWSFIAPDTLEVPRSIIATLAGEAHGMHKVIRPAALLWAGSALAGAAEVALFFSGIAGKPAPRRAVSAVAVTLFIFLSFAAVVKTYNTASHTKYFWNSGMELGKVWLAIEQATAAGGGTVISVSGTDAPYPLMGFGLRNEIVNINPDGCVNCPFHLYARRVRKLPRYAAPADSQQVYKYNFIGADKSAWLRSIRKSRARIFIAFKNNGEFPIENIWAAQTPEVFSLRRVFQEANVYEINLDQAKPNP